MGYYDLLTPQLCLLRSRVRIRADKKARMMKAMCKMAGGGLCRNGLEFFQLQNLDAEAPQCRMAKRLSNRPRSGCENAWKVHLQK